MHFFDDHEFIWLANSNASRHFFTSYSNILKGTSFTYYKILLYLPSSNIQDAKPIHILQFQDTVDRDPITTSGHVLSYFSGFASVILG
jgi:hypothetical protein